MAFVNEVVSDEDIARYNLPFKPGAGRYWTRDKENDCYLWGGISQDTLGVMSLEANFIFILKELLLDVCLEMMQSSSRFLPRSWKF